MKKLGHGACVGAYWLHESDHLRKWTWLGLVTKVTFYHTNWYWISSCVNIA